MTILKTMKGTLGKEKVIIEQCFEPSYNANEKQGQNIFYVVAKSIRMPHDIFWNHVNNGNIKIEG